MAVIYIYIQNYTKNILNKKYDIYIFKLYKFV